MHNVAAATRRRGMYPRGGRGGAKFGNAPASRPPRERNCLWKVQTPGRTREARAPSSTPRAAAAAQLATTSWPVGPPRAAAATTFHFGAATSAPAAVPRRTATPSERASTATRRGLTETRPCSRGYFRARPTGATSVGASDLARTSADDRRPIATASVSSVRPGLPLTSNSPGGRPTAARTRGAAPRAPAVRAGRGRIARWPLCVETSASRPSTRALVSPPARGASRWVSAAARATPS